MMDKSATRFIILHEKVWHSIAKDVVSTLLIVVVIGTGWLLGSSAMQWVGFLLLGLAMLGRLNKAAERLTPQQAADKLLREFGVTGQPR